MAGMFTVAAAMIAALVISETVYPAGDVEGFTRLSMIPEAEGSAVDIGVESNEQQGRSYLLRLTLEGRLLLKKRFGLAPGDESRLRVRLPSGSEEPSGRLAASIYRTSSPDTVYRRVTSWLPPP